jgi:hypothetical protein
MRENRPFRLTWRAMETGLINSITAPLLDPTCERLKCLGLLSTRNKKIHGDSSALHSANRSSSPRSINFKINQKVIISSSSRTY